jgi:transglutaminase-like putative cysteine protease
MRLVIRHSTIYNYETPVVRLAQMLRLTALSSNMQQVQRWSVRGADGHILQGVRDGFGNVATFHSLRDSGLQASVTVEGIIETIDTSGVYRPLHEWLPHAFYLAPSLYTQADQSLRDLAASVRADHRLDRLHRLMNQVRDAVDYQVETTTVAHTARDALALGSGVCQDHAHIMIAAARLMDIPARYVSGYLWAGDHGSSVASHAWMEALIPNLGWVGFDAANRICPTDSYVRLAIGRDYADAAPVRGVRAGGMNETLSVDVLVQAQQQQ